MANLFSGNILALAGAVTLLTKAYSLCSFLYPYVKPSSLPRYLKTFDGSQPWAFITGASDGIGKAFAADLASRGFSIVLHGRNPSKLNAVKSDLEARYPQREFRVVVADASQLSSVDFLAIAESVSDIAIKILVNNVGSTMPFGHEFDTVENFTARELEENVAVNGTFPLLLTGALMPNLAAHQPSLIINIGSLADIGMPLMPAYGPAKTFLMASTTQLGLEQAYKGRDIEVIGLRIGQVTDTGTIVLPKSALVPDGPTWVRSALARIGCGRTHIMPYFLHAIQAAILESLPRWLAIPVKISAINENIKIDPTGAKAKLGLKDKDT